MAGAICLFIAAWSRVWSDSSGLQSSCLSSADGQRLSSFPPFLAFCSHWVFGSIWLLSICALDDKPGTSPLIELPLALSSHPGRFVTPGHYGSWGLSGKSDTEFSCCLHASCHRHKIEWASASIHLQQGGRACWNPLLHTKTTDCAPSVAAV